MCGRFVQKSDLRKIAPLFKVDIVECDLQPSFNVAPRQPIAVIMEEGRKKIVTMQWGLIPFWAKDPAIANKLINARAETIAEKPSFRNPFKSKRCLIIADGFYEWQGSGADKRPFYICMKDEKPFGMAGIYDYWKNPKGVKIITCAIITTEANKVMAPIHHRMPVIIGPEDYDTWLDPAETDTSKMLTLLKPCDPDLLKTFEVGLEVNNPRNNSEGLIMPAERS
jgi:putative SOS response-associated peptidase YedK